MKRLWSWLPNLWIHPLSAAGTILTTVTGFMLVLVLATGWAGQTENIYAAAFLLMALPTLFVLGLLLIPVGVWLEHRRRSQAGGTQTLGDAVAALFTTKSGHRKLLVLGLLTLVNVVLLAGIGHRALGYMDTPTFCGTTCHEVMQPEYVSYMASPHARVACVECHIGPGATFLVKSKIDGLRQVWRTITNTYDRPVPVPVHTLRPSRDTCEACHWPDKFTGNRIVQRVHVDPDEDNSFEVTALALRVGGLNGITNQYEGIHWHVAADSEVRYDALDEKREEIGKVTVLKHGKVVAEYLPPGDPKPVVESRVMDCIDCHNRPTHIFDLTPARALDRGFVQGLLDKDVKWLRQVGEPILARTDLQRDEVEAAFRKDLEAAYREKHADAVPTKEQLDAAAHGLAELWLRNIFPARGVSWGTYRTNLGHKFEDPERHGCFRCHDGKHKTADGKVLDNNCDRCHEMLAEDEKPDELDDSLQVLLHLKNP